MRSLRQLFLVTVSALALSVGVPTQTTATVISGSVTGGYSANNGGTFQKLTVPFTESTPDNTIGADNLESLNLFALDEVQNLTLTSPLTLNLGGSPLPIGTVIASHYLAFDPGGSTFRSVEGTVDFDSQVLGIITSNTALNASDYLSAPGVSYLSSSLRGLEASDVVAISGAQQVTLTLTANTPGDYVRVVTAFSPLAVPEPSTLALAGLLMVVLAGRRRFRPA